MSLFSMSGSLAIRESGSLDQPGSPPPVTCSQEGLNLLHLLHLLRGPDCGPPGTCNQEELNLLHLSHLLNLLRGPNWAPVTCNQEGLSLLH